MTCDARSLHGPTSLSFVLEWLLARYSCSLGGAGESREGSYMLTVRAEAPDDVAGIHAVNQAAFGREEEAELVDRLRSRGVLTVSLVAVQPGVHRV